MKAKDFFTQEELNKIVESIEQAELETSGEIRFHMESRCKGNALTRAIQVFKNLKMHKTQLRNGTLVYLATADKKFAVIGDKGINEKVPEIFWEDVEENLSEKFKENEFVAGVCTAIEMIGEKLKEYFPYRSDDINELPNAVSIGAKNFSKSFVITTVSILFCGFIGFLLRPSSAFVGQLSFMDVITRGTNFKGMDKLLIPLAQKSFNLMLAAGLVGLILGVFISYLFYKLTVITSQK